MRAETGEKVWIKVGHGGTLDPMATGVLVLGIGSGCKALENYLKVGLVTAKSTTSTSCQAAANI